MKKYGSTIILVLIFITGLAIFAYPTISDRWNSLHSSRIIMAYAETVSGLSEEEYRQLYSAAESYNQSVLERVNLFTPSDEEKEEYATLLDVENNGIMGYVEIPVIKVSLPIYHGTSEDVLQTAAGHLDWTSLPVGGPSTHAVISGHRGLPSAELFTKLDRLVEGDRFMIYVLDETLTYEVDQIHIVLPEDMNDLQITRGEDYCTLVTCTPYGINTHRLLVRGHRVETESGHSGRVPAEAIQMEPLLVAPFIAAPLLLVMFLMMFASDGRQWNEKVENEGS